MNIGVLMGLAATLGIGCSGYAQQSFGCDPAAAMETMVSAIRTDNMPLLLSVFPEQVPVLISSTIEQPMKSESVNSKILSDDLLSHQGFYELLIRSEEDDTFADIFQSTDFGDWRPAGDGRFLPPGSEYADGRTFVRIDCTPSGAVVVEIGWPVA